MARKLLLSLLILEYSAEELKPLPDDKLQDMFDKLKSKLDGDW